MAKELYGFVSEKCCTAGYIQKLGGDLACNQRFVYHKQTWINRAHGHFVYNGDLFKFRKIYVGYK